MPDYRAETRSRLAQLLSCPAPDLPHRAADAIADDATFHMMAPLDDVVGRDAIVAQVIEPLRAALTGAQRRDEMLIGGENIREGGGTWVSGFTHVVGTHDAPLWGVAPSGRLAFLRAGEFYRLDGDGRIDRAHVIMDLPDLMRQAGRPPFPLQGTEMLFPGPATHDGVCPTDGDGAASLAIVNRMIASLHVYDPETLSSEGQIGEGGTWADDMLWYGPGGIGSNYRWDGFVRDHRDSFLTAFPDRKGGNHYCRIGDGDYVALSGWPSMTMTHQGPYLGQEPDGRALTLRVMDFYRCAKGRIAENWVFLDYVDLARQMGRDVLA